MAPKTAVSPPPHIADILNINPDDPVIHIVCLRLADNQSVLHETRYLAQSLCPALLEEDLTTNSIHALLVNKHQIPMVKMSHTVEAIQLSTEQADLLLPERRVVHEQCRMLFEHVQGGAERIEMPIDRATV